MNNAFKVQLTQELKPADYGQRREFVNWVLERQHENADFADKIIFSDEAHFHLDAFVNRQNCRIWGKENLRVIHVKQMHSQRVTVWCGFWTGEIIGPFFYENGAYQAQTVNGVRYREMITSFFVPRIEEMNVVGGGFNKTAPHVIQPEKQFNCCISYFPVVLFRVLETRIGRLDRAI